MEGVVELESVPPARLTVEAGVAVAVGAAVGGLSSLSLSQAVSAETPISVMTSSAKREYLVMGLTRFAGLRRYPANRRIF